MGLKRTSQGLNKYNKMLILGIFVFLITNQYFGWNRTAESGAERVCDFIWQVLVLFGGISSWIMAISKEAIESYIE